MQPMVSEPGEMIWLQATKNATGEYGRLRQDEMFLAGHRKTKNRKGQQLYVKLSNWTPEQHAQMLEGRGIAVRVTGA